MAKLEKNVIQSTMQTIGFIMNKERLLLSKMHTTIEESKDVWEKDVYLKNRRALHELGLIQHCRKAFFRDLQRQFDKNNLHRK